MPIKTITYKRIKNLGNYESQTLEATSVVNEGGSPDQELEDLIAFVEGELFPPEEPFLPKKSDAVSTDTEDETKLPF